MKVQDRSYTHYPQIPQIHVHINQTGDVVFFYINWGEQAHADNLIAEMEQFIHAASADVEVTHPFQWIPHLPKDVNILRIATMIGNDYLYRKENNHEFKAGIELLVLKKNKNMMSWTRVGRPALFQIGGNKISPLHSLNSPLKELPTNLLGIHLIPEIEYGHFQTNDHSQLMAYCGVDWPMIDAVKPHQSDVEFLFQELLKVQPDISGFWLGVIN